MELAYYPTTRGQQPETTIRPTQLNVGDEPAGCWPGVRLRDHRDTRPMRWRKVAGPVAMWKPCQMWRLCVAGRKTSLRTSAAVRCSSLCGAQVAPTLCMLRR
jgi:hypothetical protein